MTLLRRRDRTEERALASAQTLESQGRALSAIDVLTEANRKKPTPKIEAQLVRTRNHAFDQLGDSESDYAEPVSVGPSEAVEDDGLPSVTGAALDAARIRGALLSHGALLVRDLVPEDNANELKAGIDKAFDRRNDQRPDDSASEVNPWYEPFRPADQYAAAVEVGRRFVSKGSGIWTADSPRTLFRLLDIYESIGLRRIVQDYLGERPALSVNKGTLRRAEPSVGTEWWHQDGAFLGRGIRSLNVWLSLSHCGVEAPGLEVVPRRIGEIVECGTEGADFDWSVGDSVVAEVSGGSLSRPAFRPGDALLFDHLFLHRTGSDPAMTKTRYAIETWFFAPSAYPDPQDQVPLAY